jgi:hypothetical protein
MKTREEKLAAIDASMKRWLTRNKRATNQLSRLARQRDRLLKQRDPMRVGKMSTAMAKALEIVDEKKALDIPPVLQRPLIHHDDLAHMPSNALPKAGDPGPKMLEDLLNPAAAINRKRLERNDAKRRGPAKIDKTAMPLSGRDAMKAIKAARKGAGKPA